MSLSYIDLGSNNQRRSKLCHNCEGHGCWHCSQFVELAGGPRDGDFVARGEAQMVFANALGFYYPRGDGSFYTEMYHARTGSVIGGITVYHYTGVNAF